MPKLLSLSERRSRTARINGAKSRGPVSTAGKARSARNAVKHGLRSTQILPEEMSPDFTAISRKFAAELNPSSALEHALVLQMALAGHRLEQIWLMEAAAFRRELLNIPHLSGTAATVEAFRRLVRDGTLPILHRYEVAERNRLHLALRHLADLRGCNAAQNLENRPVPNEPTIASTPAAPAASGQFAASEPPQALAASASASIAAAPMPQPQNMRVPNEPTASSTKAESATSHNIHALSPHPHSLNRDFLISSPESNVAVTALRYPQTLTRKL